MTDTFESGADLWGLHVLIPVAVAVALIFTLSAVAATIRAMSQCGGPIFH